MNPGDANESVLGMTQAELREMFDRIGAENPSMRSVLGVAPVKKPKPPVSLEGVDPLESPAAFAAKWSGETAYRLNPYRHIVVISDALAAGLVRDEWDILVVTTPPRHGKSLTISIWTPAWFLCRFKQWVGLATYEADFARGWGRKTREVMRRVGPEYGLSIKTDSRAADMWEIHGHDAGMWTAGVGGPVTGKGVMLGIVDDPVKNDVDAASEDKRETNWQWWTTTFFTRRNSDKAKLVLLQTRWHEDDLAGRVLEHADRAREDDVLLGDEYDGQSDLRLKHLNMPALCEDSELDPMHREIGEALCPERFNEQALIKIRKAITDRPFTALFQQAPSIAGGNVYKRDSFVYFHTTARDRDRMHVNETTGEIVNVDDCVRVGIMDTAYTRAQRSDFTVLAIFDILPTVVPSLALVDGKRVKVDSTEHAELIQWAHDVHRVAWVGVEKMIGSLSLFDQAARRGLVVRQIPVEGNKHSRAETGSTVVKQGRIWFPHKPWMPRWEAELTGFPTAKHDDVTDVISYAGVLLARGELRVPRRHKEELPRGQANVRRIARRQRQRGSSLYDLLGKGFG